MIRTTGASCDQARNPIECELELMRRVAERVTQGASGMEDLVQDTWIAARRQPRSQLLNREAWFQRVMRRLWINHARSEAARRRREAVSARHELVADATFEPEQEELRAAVQAELSGLKPKYREALRLRFMDELTPREVSERLGVPLETARTRIKRAQGALRGRLERWTCLDGRRLRAPGPDPQAS